MKRVCPIGPVIIRPRRFGQPKEFERGVTLPQLAIGHGRQVRLIGTHLHIIRKERPAFPIVTQIHRLATQGVPCQTRAKLCFDSLRHSTGGHFRRLFTPPIKAFRHDCFRIHAQGLANRCRISVPGDRQFASAGQTIFDVGRPFRLGGRDVQGDHRREWLHWRAAPDAILGIGRVQQIKGRLQTFKINDRIGPMSGRRGVISIPQ